VHWRSALLSAAAAAAGISIAKEFYSNLMTHVLGYSALYGSLASVPIFLIWLLVLWWISLAGVALCAALERRHYGA
jgi:membrane protein